jgi:ketosteroid isomerase-like protein
MRKSCCLGLFWASLAFACNPAPTRDPATELNPNALRDTLLATANDWNQGNLEAFVSPYDSLSTFMTRSGPIGKEAMLDHYRRTFFSQGQPVQDLRFEQVRVRPLGEDHALMTGQYLLSGGGHPDHTGWFSLVWLRTENGWKILHDHSS